MCIVEIFNWNYELRKIKCLLLFAKKGILIISKEEVPDSDLVLFLHKWIKLNSFKQCHHFIEMKEQDHAHMGQCQQNWSFW